ncbi:unnamed protein product [Acanthosepion pharaonis]|uniref:Uncharacterized protein n=1 Tax=Acanthosepion pharaonis TaxID=158019 RepID=A0A812E2R8_ACAPH|nr:unnamed protein product [Sepia pharaonis]
MGPSKRAGVGMVSLWIASIPQRPIRRPPTTVRMWGEASLFPRTLLALRLSEPLDQINLLVTILLVSARRSRPQRSCSADTTAGHARALCDPTTAPASNFDPGDAPSAPLSPSTKPFLLAMAWVFIEPALSRANFSKTGVRRLAQSLLPSPVVVFGVGKGYLVLFFPLIPFLNFGRASGILRFFGDGGARTTSSGASLRISICCSLPLSRPLRSLLNQWKQKRTRNNSGEFQQQIEEKENRKVPYLSFRANRTVRNPDQMSLGSIFTFSCGYVWVYPGHGTSYDAWPQAAQLPRWDPVSSADRVTDHFERTVLPHVVLKDLSLEQGAKSEVFYFQTTGHMGTGLVLSVSVQLPACPFGLRLRACVCSVSNSPRLLILWGPVKGLGWAWCLSGSPAYPNDQSEGFLQPSECGEASFFPRTLLALRL